MSHRDRIRRVLEDYTAVFGGRDRELEALDEWLFDSERPCGLVQAPTGRGKTALLAKWASSVQSFGWHVVFHPISVRYETADINTTTLCLGHALGPLFDADPPGLNQSPEVVQAQIVEWLRHGIPESERLLLIVDGLDEGIGDYVKSLLPGAPGPRVKILASARPLAGTDPFWWVNQLKWDVAATRVFDLGLLSHSDLAKVLRAQPSDELNALADDPAFVDELTRVSEGDPLTARVIIDALRAGDVTPESLSHRPPGLDAYLEEWMHQLEVEAESEEAWQLLGLCAVALGPLTADDVAELVPDAFKKSRDVRRAVRTVDRFIVGDGNAGSGYVFSHPRLREYFKEQLLDQEREAHRDAFVRYGLHAFHELPKKPCPTYVRRFWIRHLCDAGKWEDLHTVVATSPGEKLVWAEAHHSASGNYAGYLSDLSLAWQYADEMEMPEGITVGRQVRYALIESSIHSLATNIPVDLLLALVKHGIWTPIQGLIYADQASAGRNLTPAAEILRWLPESCQQEVLDEALDAVRRIENGCWRAEALAELAPRLPEELREQVLREALEATRGHGDAHERAKALAGIAPYLAGELRERVLDEALEEARQTDGGVSRAMVLARLAPHLPVALQEPVVREALEAVRTIEHGWWQVEPLAKLAPRMTEDLLRTALDVARETRGDAWRAKALATLAPYLPETLRRRVLDEALETARVGADAEARAEGLAGLIAHLPEELQQHVLDEALETARSVETRWLRGWILAQLVPHLARLGHRQEALEAARGIEDGDWRAVALARLAPYFPERWQPRVLAEAMTVVQGIRDESVRFSAVANLAPSLTKHLLPEALKAVWGVHDGRVLDHALAGVVRCLGASGDWEEALKAAHETRWLEGFAEALGSLVAYLPQEWQEPALDEALKAARSVPSTYSRAETLASIVPHLPLSVQEQVVREALETGRGTWDYFFEDAIGNVKSDLVCHLARLGHPREALAMARGEQNGWSEAQTLARIVMHLPVKLLQEALEIARGLEQVAWQDQVLARSVARLVELGHREKALEVAQEIEACEYRAEALLELTRGLPEGSQREVLDDALEVAQNDNDWSGQPEALIGLASGLAAFGYPEEALAATQEIEYADTRANVLAGLVPYLVSWERDQPEAALSAWNRLLHASAVRTRRNLLFDICAVAPLIAALGGREALLEIAQAIQDVGRWWP